MMQLPCPVVAALAHLHAISLDDGLGHLRQFGIGDDLFALGQKGAAAIEIGWFRDRDLNRLLVIFCFRWRTAMAKSAFQIANQNKLFLFAGR